MNKEKALQELEAIYSIYNNELIDINRCMYWIECCKDVSDETVELLKRARKQQYEAYDSIPEDEYISVSEICRKEFNKL